MSASLSIFIRQAVGSSQRLLIFVDNSKLAFFKIELRLKQFCECNVPVFLDGQMLIAAPTA
jgi:hypothetical protein